MKKFVNANTLINAVLFQVTWFACALGGAKGMLWPGLLSGGVLALYQLQTKNRHHSDLMLMALALILGLIVDSTWIQLGFVDYNTASPFAGTAPIWIITLWVAFALTINHSLAWLAIHPLLPAAAGLICAPLSYIAGAKLEALSFATDSALIISAMGIAWAVALTILVRASTLPANAMKKLNSQV